LITASLELSERANEITIAIDDNDGSRAARHATGGGDEGGEGVGGADGDGVRVLGAH